MLDSRVYSFSIGAIIQHSSGVRVSRAIRNPLLKTGAEEALNSIAIVLFPFSSIRSISVPEDVL